MTILATPTTELEAVNVLLSAIGESPVNSLEDTGIVEVTMAKAVLQETLTHVLERGWHFNTEEEFPLVPDTSGNINVPANALMGEVSVSSAYMDVAVRGTKLYDRENHTYTFTETLYVKLTIGLAFEDCPQAVRRYVTIVASRVFQKRVLGSDVQYKFSQDEEAAALVGVERSNLQTKQANVLNSSWSVARILRR